MTYFGLFQQDSDTDRPTASPPPAPPPPPKKIKRLKPDKNRPTVKILSSFQTDLKLKTSENILYGANEKKIF